MAVCSSLLAFLGCASGHRAERSELPPTPETRALSFLAREVPSWSKENRCFSCHNNGDAARALYVGYRQSYPIPKQALADTTDWLAHPERWDHNRGDPGFSDQCLARIQFAAALVTAAERGFVRSTEAMDQAARLVADCQSDDGGWRLGVAETLGSPATYGNHLLTRMALRVLRASSSPEFRGPIRNAENWISRAPVHTVLDAAAVLLGLTSAQDANAASQNQRCLELIRRGQAANGGWGPYVTSPPEVFDTALALLALEPLADQAEFCDRIRRGRQYLLTRQETDGSWPETTRPPGAESYAQRLSTTGWATLALLATKNLASL